MMTIEKPKTETTFFLSPFRKDYTDQELVNEIRNDRMLSQLENAEIFFTIDDLIYAIAVIEDSNVIQIKKPIKKTPGKIGLRKTNDISKVPLRAVTASLNVYFGYKHFMNDSFLPGDGKDPSIIARMENLKAETKINKETGKNNRDEYNSFRAGNDLYCFLVRFSDNMNSSEYDSEKTIMDYEAHLGARHQFSEGINNNMLQRSLGADKIPFHAFEIKNSVIVEALKNLSFKYFQHLQIWYFDDQDIEFPKNLTKKQLNKAVSEYYRFQNWRCSKHRDRYMKAWRMREKALNMLVMRIRDVLKRLQDEKRL